MKLTLDTNVLISGSFWKGASYRILSLIEESVVELILSQEIIDEYFEALHDEEVQEKIIRKKLILFDIVENVIEHATMVIPLTRLIAVPRDSDDNIILECALEGAVDYVITQDTHLLELQEFRGIKIVKPEEFLSLFSSY